MVAEPQRAEPHLFGQPRHAHEVAERDLVLDLGELDADLTDADQPRYAFVIGSRRSRPKALTASTPGGHW